MRLGGRLLNYSNSEFCTKLQAALKSTALFVYSLRVFFFREFRALLDQLVLMGDLATL